MPYDSVLPILSRLADSALKHAQDGLVEETDVSPSLGYLYTETHLALLLYLLHRDGLRRQGLSEAAARLRVWDSLLVKPTFFNSMAVSLLALLVRENKETHPELAAALASIIGRRQDFAEDAWHHPSGNNMYLQQLATDVLLVPLSEGRGVAADAADRLDVAFASCMSSEGYFFDLPRPGVRRQPQFPLTYNLKILFLLAICCRYFPTPGLEHRLRLGLQATIPLFTSEGDCSYFGRTDRTTFAAGLAVFCLRAAATRGLGGRYVNDLALRSESMFRSFPAHIPQIEYRISGELSAVG